MDYQEGLKYLIQLLEQTAPELWAIAMRQVEVNLIANSLTLAVVLILTIINLRIMYIYYNKEDNEELPMHMFLGLCPLFFLVLFDLALMHSIIGMVINPEFYAINILLNYAN